MNEIQKTWPQQETLPIKLLDYIIYRDRFMSYEVYIVVDDFTFDKNGK